MQIEELRALCEEAARDLVRTRGRPVPPAVVLPGSARTELVTLPELPPDDTARHELMARLATDRVSAERVPCWGFVAEAEVGGEDAVVLVFGARRHPPQVTAARFDDHATLAGFVPPEELDPAALPFLHPLQHAVDALPAEDDVLGVHAPDHRGPAAPPDGPG